MKTIKTSLNPCFNGICSRRVRNPLHQVPGLVLILVLMEYALGVDLKTGQEGPSVGLILVLMEYALGGGNSQLSYCRD